jgi:hypothetical protein
VESEEALAATSDRMRRGNACDAPVAEKRAGPPRNRLAKLFAALSAQRQMKLGNA